MATPHGEARGAANDRLLESAALAEFRDGALARRGHRLRGVAGRRVGHEYVAAKIRHVEGDELIRADRSRCRERVSGYQLERIVERVDGAARVVGGEQFGVGLIDGEAR